MKTLLATLATIIVGIIALPNQAEAHHGRSDHTYRSGRTSCGCDIYTRRVITGYDCHHRPIYRYRSVPVAHRCRSHHRHYGKHHGHAYHRSHHSNYRRHGRHISRRTHHGNVRICR